MSRFRILRKKYNLTAEKSIELNRKLFEAKIFQVKINTLLEFRICAVLL